MAESLALSETRRDSAPFLLGAAASVACLLPLVLTNFVQLSVSLGDEGLILQGARRVLHGQVPYRDFASIITPGTFYLLAACFRVMGESLLTARLLVWLIHCLTMLALLGLMAELDVPFKWRFVGIAALLGAGTPQWYVISHHWLCNLLVLASAWMLLKAMRGGPLEWIVGAGAIAGLAAMVLQDQGGYWIVGALAAIALCASPRRWKSLALFSGGSLLAAAPWALYLLTHASAGRVVHDLVVAPMSGYSAINRPALGRGLFEGLQLAEKAGTSIANWMPALYGCFRQVQDLLVLAAPLGALVLLTWAFLRKGGGQRGPEVAVLTALGLSFVLCALHRPAMVNFLWALPGPLVACLWGLGRLAGGWKPRHAASFAVAVALVFAVVALFHCVVFPLRDSPMRVSFRGGHPEVVTAEERQVLDRVSAFGTQALKPTDQIFCFSYCPLYYFLLQADNPTRYDTFTYTPDDSAELLSTLRGMPPDWILLDRVLSADDPLMSWITANYHQWLLADHLVIMRRDAPQA